MKMLPFRLLLLTVSLLICAGCSVKEDRIECPCRLLLDFSEVDPSVIKSADYHLSASDGFIFTGSLESVFFKDQVVIDVPRETIKVVSWCGAGIYASESGLTIPYGDDCPPVYMHVSDVEASGESVSEVVVMRKNHCNMRINVIGEDRELVNLILHGNVNGYGSDGHPSKGRFAYKSAPDANGEISVVLPRQVDNTLALEVDDGTGLSKSFAIGEYISSSGYDWTAPDLHDIIIDIDFAITHVSLTINGWDKEYKYDIVI
jgi:hypothetical protein